MSEHDTEHYEKIGVQWDAWKLRQSDPKLSQEDAEYLAILRRQSRKIRRSA